jgi:hypothetical protein
VHQMIEQHVMLYRGLLERGRIRGRDQ